MPRLSYPCTNWPMGNIHQFYWVMGWKKKEKKKAAMLWSEFRTEEVLQGKKGYVLWSMLKWHNVFFHTPSFYSWMHTPRGKARNWLFSVFSFISNMILPLAPSSQIEQSWFLHLLFVLPVSGLESGTTENGIAAGLICYPISQKTR